MSILERIIKEIDMLSEQERQKVLDQNKRKIYGRGRYFIGGKLRLVG